MIRFAFRKGLCFLEGTRRWTLIRRLATGKVQVEDQMGEVRTYEMSQMHADWRSGKWVIDEESLSEANNVFYLATPRDLSSYDEAKQAGAKRKQTYLERLADAFAQAGQRFVYTPNRLVPKIQAIARQLGDRQPPSPASIYKWRHQYAPTRCVTKLVDRRSQSGRRRDSTIFSVFEEAMSEVFLTPQKQPGNAVFDAVLRKIGRINAGVEAPRKIVAPSRATVYRWLKSLHQDLVMRAREGKAHTERELRMAIGTVRISKVLERIEIDHSPVDLFIIDKVTGLVLGRPWLTVAIDRFSRCIVGVYFSFHAPSAYSVMYCLRQAILPKQTLLQRFPDIRHAWPCHGIPDLVACDNGMDLHADAVESVYCDLGIEVLYCGVGEPQAKAVVERVQRTIAQDLFHRIPGTTFSNTGQRGDYPSEDLAAIDLQTLVHLTVRWIVDCYHQTPHRGLGGRTPHDVWIEAEPARAIELPAYPQQLDIIVGQSATRTVFHYGVEVDSLRYNSPLLQAIRARDWDGKSDNPQVAVRFYEDDTSYVNVLDPKSHEYIQVPAVDQAYTAGLHRQMHRMVRAEVQRRFGDEWRQAQLLEVREEIQAIVDKAVRSASKRGRKRAAVLDGYDSDQILRGRRDDLSEARKPHRPATVAADQDDDDCELDLPDYGTSHQRPAEVA